MSSTPEAPADPVSQDSREARDLRSMTTEGVFFSVMVGVGETYVPAFALAAGLGDVVAGLVATVPMLAGALFQLVTPWAVRHLRSYRRWVVACAAAQALSFSLLIAGAWTGRIDIALLAVATVAYWSAGMAVSPAWNAWVTTLVPAPRRARYFAHRTRWAQAALFAAILAGGLILETGRSVERELLAFGVAFAVALCARLVSSLFLSRQSEAPGLAMESHALGPRAIQQAVRDAGSTRVLVYLLGVQLVVNVAAPFFTPYMLGPLALSYAEFMLLTATAFLARVAVLPLLGRLAERRGVRPLLWLGASGIVPLPVLWLVSHELVYLVGVQLCAGAAWAALEYATLLSFFEGIPDRVRASVLSAFNLVNAVAMAGGALLGTRLFLSAGGAEGAYAWLFAVSAVGRLAMLAVLRSDVAAERARTLHLRTLAVRPTNGGIARPILAELEEGPPRSQDDQVAPPRSRDRDEATR